MIIDDVRAEHLFNFIERGLLPNLKKLMESGIYSKNCITDFPAVTFPTQQSILTGTYTGDYRKELCHGVPLTNWMGRDRAPPILRAYAGKNFQIYKMSKELGQNCKTILEMIENGNTLSIAQFINRGADYIFPESKIKLIYYYLLFSFRYRKRKLIDLIARANTITVLQLLKSFEKPKKYFGNKEPPIASSILFFTSDILCHMFGYDSRIYKVNLMHIDKVIGLLIKKLDNMGYLEETAIAVISDHGNYKTSETGNIRSFLTHNEFSHYHPRRNRRGNINISDFGGVGFFNFKGKKNLSLKHQWARPTIAELETYGPKRINLTKALFKIKGTHLMYYREDNNTFNKGSIHLKRKDMKTGKIYNGTVEYRGSGMNFKTLYRSDDNENDIFGYFNDDIASKLMDNKYHSIQEWMDATYHLNYPMYPDLITRHFKNPRSSDIIISTDGTIVYNPAQKEKKTGYKYTHDIGLRKCVIVPLIIGGSSEIPNKEIPYCKTTDMVPTLLKIIGQKPHKSVIGESLI